MLATSPSGVAHQRRTLTTQIRYPLGNLPARCFGLQAPSPHSRHWSYGAMYPRAVMRKCHSGQHASGESCQGLRSSNIQVSDACCMCWLDALRHSTQFRASTVRHILHQHFKTRFNSQSPERRYPPTRLRAATIILHSLFHSATGRLARRSRRLAFESIDPAGPGTRNCGLWSSRTRLEAILKPTAWDLWSGQAKRCATFTAVGPNRPMPLMRTQS
jgi:hypothetical protein